MRAHVPLTTCVAAVLLLAGCSGDSSGPASQAPSATATSRPADAPTPPYGATLVAGDDEGTALLTNVGRKADRYVVVVTPSSWGAATPATIELEPGATAEVRYQLASPDSVGGSPVLQAHSTTTGEDVDLPLD